MNTILMTYFKYIGNELGTKRRNTVLSLLRPQPRASYLDCGCGDGKFTAELANKIDTRRIWGIEIIDSEIVKARKQGITVYKADLDRNFPLPSNSFDVVTAIQVIEHLFEVDTFVSELHRVLKPGGTAIISTENLASWHNIFALVFGLQPSTGPYISNRFSIGFHPLATEHTKKHKKNPHLAVMRGHTRVMAYQSFLALFQAYGFRIETVKAVGYYPLPSPFSGILARLDPTHAVDMIARLRKL